MSISEDIAEKGFQAIMAHTCYLCGGEHFTKRTGSVRDNGELKVLECVTCGLVFLSSFEHIKSDFYEQSGMHAQDIDVQAWLRQSASDDDRRFRQFRRCLENKTILDFGCGAGGFLSRARNVASRVCGIEIEARLAPFFRENALDVRRDIDDFDETFDIITLFHVLEHFPDPVSLLRQLAQKLRPGGRIIVEVPNSDDALLTLYRCEPFTHFTYWSCHLFLFKSDTLAALTRKADLAVDYLQHIQRYTPANHLHWLSCGRPGGHAKWHFLDSEELSAAYEKSLAAIGRTDTLICTLSRKE
jgi:2-polyprenyl-3-methyl-5-hydroxy-6-metoxy-1,4-benzoquinol methylase